MYCFLEKPLHVQQYIITIKTYNLKDKKYSIRLSEIFMFCAQQTHTHIQTNILTLLNLKQKRSSL